MRRISLALALLGAAAAGCSGGSTSNQGGARGVAEGNFTVRIQNGQDGNTGLAITGGVVTSSASSLGGSINCGSGNTACDVVFANTDVVTLTATPNVATPELFFLGWAGDCAGDAPTCTLSAGKADRYVVAQFGTAAQRASHPNFSDAAVHAAEFAEFYAAPTTYKYQCTSCHGATLQGQGIALSCAMCHPAPNAPAGIGPSPLVLAEQCVGCHADSGSNHQAAYNRYKDASDLAITVDGVTSVENATPGTYTATMTVTITKGGAPLEGLIEADGVGFAAATMPQKTFYATTFDGATGKFDTTVSFNANTARATATPGQYTLTATTSANGSTGTNVTSPLAFQIENGPAIAFAYVTDTPMTFEAFPVYDNVGHDGLEFGTVDYTSAANDAACQKCHGTPYRKHGYRVASTPDLDDFAACKVCHYDTRNGSHRDWQCLVDDPAAYAAGTCATLASYPSTAYKASVMNDTHMSHAMEFAYPQSMANCVTCHEGKLGQILTDAKFTLETCKSCHPITAVGGADPKRAPALAPILAAAAYNHAGIDLYTYTGACNGCHNGSGAPTFGEIHSGYNKLIYAGATGTKFSDAFTAAISNASVAANVLSFTVTVTENTDVPGLAATDILPAAYIAPYGFDTKDFILASKNQKLAVAAGGTLTIGAGWTVTPGTPTATSMSWAVTADLAVVGGTTWTDRIANNTINRVELGVMPFLPNLDGITYIPHGATTPATAPVALNFVTRTFDLDGNAFADGFYAPIVNANKCNACHDALGTTFHTADRGGNVVGCRICHVTLNAGSHLEMQSRSIDSYVHAIHAMQPFDSGDVVFSDPVEALHYDHHVESTYPNFSLLNCESCHNPGTYDAPTAAGSLPGLLSAADAWANGRTRTIGAVPSVITGPAARACGSCHRAAMINEDAAAELTAFDGHTAAFGYREPAATTLNAVIAKIQEYIDALIP